MKRFFTTYVILAITTLCISFFGIRLLYPTPVTLHPLARLTIPSRLATVYLPGPYEAAYIESPVLGAETIDPDDIITYINNERMKRGAPPLVKNALLTKAAQMRANVILKYQNFSHQDPHEHIQLDTVLPMVNYPFIYASENIGMGNNSAEDFVNGFMSSASHRANLLNPELQETGVALVSGQYKQYWVNIVVQIFAIPTTEDNYLGYTTNDVNQYKNLLADVNQQLALTRDRLSNHIGNMEYYEGWQKILIRQQEILTELYDTTLNRQPFVKNIISLMSEYNQNWNLVPKQSNI